MDFLKPFVLPVPARTPEHCDTLDVYLPGEVVRPRPAILFVHGGPLPAEVRPGPRDWPVFEGYGSLAAARGAVGAVVGHRLHSPDAYATTAGDVQAAVELLRGDPRIDGERLALWFFSGGALLAADWLREPPAWLRVLGLSYPLLAALPGWPVSERFRSDRGPVGGWRSADRADPGRPGEPEDRRDGTAVRGSGVEGVPGDRGRARRRHSFDVLDDDDASRAAISRAADLVMATLVKGEAH
jgi:hypothetical protein